MEPVFSNCCEYNMEVYREFSKRRFWGFRACALIGVLAAIGSALSYVPWGGGIQLVPMFMALFLLVCFFWFHWYIAWMLNMADKRDYQGPVIMQSFFYADRVEFREKRTGRSAGVEYRKIQKIVRTKNLIIFMPDKWKFYILRRDGFAGVDEKAFEAFLQEKASNARIRW